MAEQWRYDARDRATNPGLVAVFEEPPRRCDCDPSDGYVCVWHD